MPVFSVCVTPDRQHVVTASLDKTARVWLLSDGSFMCARSRGTLG